MCDVKIGKLGKFDLNPRGELWRKDENRFGHKLLSKFGWSQGKGLGKNEDGIAENLKVRIKMGNTGIGWDEKLPIGIDYQDYDAVLKDLSTRFKKPGEVKNEEISLEKRSQCFRNKRRIQKFVRGKDISQYSKKDMSCIFLSREYEKEMKSTPKETVVTNIESRPVDHSAKESMPTFSSQLSIADYFAMKMKNKIGSSSNIPNESETCKESSEPETDSKSKKRKHELKNSKKAKRIKREPELSTAGGSLSCEEENNSESSSSSLEAPDEMISEEQFQNVEKCDGEIVRKKKKMSKEIKKLMSASKSKQNIENNQQEENVAEKNSSESKSLEEQEKNSNSTEECISVTEKKAMSKKRKKDQKSCKKAKKCLEEADISSSVEKNSSFSESDDEKEFSQEDNAKSVKTNEWNHKETKKYKNKILNLKSCLKNCLSNNTYSFKEKRKVSFCENISYKKIENALNNFDSDVILETNEQLLSCSDEDCTDSEVPNETENVGVDHEDDSNSLDKSNDDVQCGEGVPGHENSDVENNTVPECFKLPKLSSANYDSWLETQRIAAQMKVYKNMAKKMKKHPVLRKTNLLEIKGYGNWGL